MNNVSMKYEEHWFFWVKLIAKYTDHEGICAVVEWWLRDWKKTTVKTTEQNNSGPNGKERGKIIMCLWQQGNWETTEMVNGLEHKRNHFKLVAKIIFKMV